MPYPAYGSSHRFKQRRPAQAQRRWMIYIRRRTRGYAGWRHQCLIRPTGPPTGSNSAGPRKRSAAGRYTSDAVPAVVPDGGINALSGLRLLPQAQTAQARASAAPPGRDHRVEFDEKSGCRKAKPSHRLGSLNKWCPDSESNQGHGDFQSPALPTELSGQRGALNRNPPTPSTKFLKLLVDCLSLRQFRVQRRILTQYHCMPLSPSRLFQPLVTEITWRNPEIR